MCLPQTSSILYVLSLYFNHITFGTWTFLLNIIFILIQILFLKKEFQPVQYLQILDIIVSAISVGKCVNIISKYIHFLFCLQEEMRGEKSGVL